MIGATLGAIASTKMNVKELRKFFGIFLAIVAIYEIYSFIRKYIFKIKRENNNIKEENIKEEI